MVKFVHNVTSNNSIIQTICVDQTPYFNADNTRPMDGVLRLNGKNLEYYRSGIGWYPMLGTQVSIDVDPRIQIVLDWAVKKMAQESEEQTLAEQYPAFKTAKENYELVKTMVQNG